MKRFLNTILVAGALIGVAAVATGQNPPTQRDAKTGFKQGGGRHLDQKHAGKKHHGAFGKHGAEKVREMKQKFVTELGLTQAQQARLQQLRQAQFEKFRALHEQAKNGTDRASLKAQFETLRRESQSQFLAVLTPAQRTKLESMKREAAKKWQERRQIKPNSIP